MSVLKNFNPLDPLGVLAISKLELEDLPLSFRGYGHLKQAHFSFFWEIAAMPLKNLLTLRQIGKKTASSLITLVQNYFHPKVIESFYQNAENFRTSRFQDLVNYREEGFPEFLNLQEKYPVLENQEIRRYTEWGPYPTLTLGSINADLAKRALIFATSKEEEAEIDFFLKNSKCANNALKSSYEERILNKTIENLKADS